MREILLADVELVVKGNVFRHVPALFMIHWEVVLNHRQSVSQAVRNILMIWTVYIVMRGVVMRVKDLGIEAKRSWDFTKHVLRGAIGFSLFIYLRLFFKKLKLIFILLFKVLAGLLLLRATSAFLSQLVLFFIMIS